MEAQQAPKTATKILTPIEELLKTLFGKEGQVNWYLGPRNHREISIEIGEELAVSNLFSLSTGESLLLDLFLTIIRDYDLSNSSLSSLEDISGMVIIDEIDLHLHIDFQKNLLPQLLKLFPKVQFIITTHSPLFLLGMEEQYTENGYQLIEMPHGKQIEVERYSEFEAAYNSMKKTARFECEVQSIIENAQKTQVFMEGTTDIKYIQKAAELLDESDLFTHFDFQDGGGSGNLDNLWTIYNKQSVTLPQKIILLFDCDAKSTSEHTKNLFKKYIPQQNNKINKGIENLFSDEAIEKAFASNSAYVDITDAHSKSVQGEKKEFPEKWEVNKNQKKNLCDWLCENGTKEHFNKFSIVFDILKSC